MFSFWLGLWKNEYLGFLMFSESLFEINHWLMFSNSWVTIWNNYLISFYEKNNCWCHLHTLLGSISLKYFLSRTDIKEIRVVIKLSLVEHHMWSCLSLFFIFHWFEWILSYLRGSLWTIHHFSPLYHIVPIFLRKMEWSTVSKAFHRSMNTPSVYLLFSKDSIIWSTNCTTEWSVEWIVFNIKYYFRSSICTNGYTLCARVFWKTMEAQLLVTTALTFINRNDPCFFKPSWKTPFSVERLNKYFKGSHKRPKHFLITS